MSRLKFGLCVLFTSLIIVVGEYILKMSVGEVLDSMGVRLDISKFLSTILSTTHLVLIFLKVTKCNSYRDIGSYVHFITTSEHLGISITVSSFILAFRSFYMSFSNFQESLTSLYTAFVFMTVSIILIYGETGVPSSTVVLSASHISLLLAFLGLAIMITPNMMKPATVVAYMATFSLLVSAVLFLMNTVRSNKVVDGFRLNEKRIITSSGVLGSLQFVDEMVEEVFADDELEFSDYNNEKDNERVKYRSPGDKNSKTKFDNCECKESLKFDSHESIQTIVDEIINELTEQAKSIDKCVNYLISNVKCSPPITLKNE